MTRRLRLSRARGFDLQKHSRALNGLPARNCARPSRWGNPFPVDRLYRKIVLTYDFESLPIAGSGIWNAMFRTGDDHFPPPEIKAEAMRLAREAAVGLHRALVERFARQDPRVFNYWIAPLRGHNLGCWCELDEICHVDTLLEIANR